MANSGRRRNSTAAQRAEVRLLAASGVSVRAIAAQVFGDAALRGRVERILAGPAEAAESPAAVRARESELREFAELGRAGQLRWLFERRLTALAERDESTSAGELRALVDLDRRLRALEHLERLQTLTRSEDTG